MHTKSIFLTTLFVLLFAGMGLSQSNWKLSSTQYISAPSGLNMRQAPSTSGAKILKLPYGAKVKIQENTSKKLTFEGIKGHWVKIKYNDQTGYIFDGFMCPLPGPPLSEEYPYLPGFITKNVKILSERKEFEKDDSGETDPMYREDITRTIRELEGGVTWTNEEIGDYTIEDHYALPNVPAGTALMYAKIADCCFKTASLKATFIGSGPGKYEGPADNPSAVDKSMYVNIERGPDGRLKRYYANYQHEAGSAWVEIKADGKNSIVTFGSHAD